MCFQKLKQLLAQRVMKMELDHSVNSHLRILVLSDRIPPESMGGAGRVAWWLASGFRDEGHEVYAISATPGSSFYETREGIQTYHLHSSYPRRLREYFALYNPQTTHPLRRILREIKPDIINVHNVHSDLSWFSLSIARQLNIPVVFNSHDVMPFAYAKLTHFIDPKQCGVESPDEYRLPTFYNLRKNKFRFNPFRNLFIRHSLTNDVQARIAVSRAHRDALEANDLPSFRVIHNGIPENYMRVSPESIYALQTQLALENKRVILCAGRLTGSKGLWRILDAMQEVIKRVPDAVLVLLSSHDYSQTLIGSKYKNLLPDHIRTAGWLSGDKLAAAYQLASVVSVPSIYLDPFPTVNLEAMAAGKPIIATCFGGSPEAVIDGETGFVINPFDTLNFAKRIETLLLDADLSSRMGRAGLEHVRKKFSLKWQIEQILGVFREVLAGRT